MWSATERAIDDGLERHRPDAPVVDAELSVRGIEGLRVADASVMPYIVNANTNFPSIMIGEKCAEVPPHTA